MAGTPHERVLAAEMIVCVGAQTADALSDAYDGTFALPDPSRYFATVIVFAMLSGAAMFGERAGRLASTFGGVATLAILLAPTKASTKAGKPEPLAMRVLGYFAQVMGGGTQRPTGLTPSTPAPQGTIGSQVIAGGGGQLGTPGKAPSLTPISPTNLAPPLS